MSSHSKTELMTVLRSASYMTRFHTLPGNHQNVGHHTWNVMAIIQCFWPDCRKELLLAAMYHDVPEIMSGDIPAPFKWGNPKLSEILETLEANFLKKYGWHQELTDSERTILKIADTFDLVLYAQEQIALGNSAYQSAMLNGLHHLVATYAHTKELTPLAEVMEGLNELLKGVPRSEQH
jgi:5'-deoxynucleotidase YfbR-like HD superfamily hydrolase